MTHPRPYLIRGARINMTATEPADHGFAAMVGTSPAMLAVTALLARVAESPATTVLLEGETGTGKALAARVLHENSCRSMNPMVTVPCAELPARVLEREIFGREPAPASEATDQPGVLLLADGGTVLLDDVSALSRPMQLKVLRFLEEGTFTHAGGVRHMHADVRIVASTTRDLGEMVAEGSFRQDLYYRLQVVPIQLPPLRERTGDIPRLTAHFLTRFAAEFGKGFRELTPEAMTFLENYSWPGNVRQLRNALERVVLLLDSHWIDIEDLDFLTADGTPQRFRLPEQGVDLQDVECQLLQQALERTRGNYTHAGRLLGINRDQVRYRVEKFKIGGPGASWEQH